jgi:serine/threonine protein kinase
VGSWIPEERLRKTRRFKGASKLSAETEPLMEPAEQLQVSADEQIRRAFLRVDQLVRERWHLDAVLGVGGTAAVYAATHRNGKRVALKILHPELSAIPEIRQRFIDEGYAANRVGHPGAVSVIDDDVTDEGDVFLIMDLLDGETVDQAVGEGWLLPDRVLTIADAILDVLAAAHDQGIVHRDVKPDNIFITRDGTIRLLDFGIARMTMPGRTDTTDSGATLGTPAFMPPEQARGQWDQVDGRTDLWAVGATMFFLLTGHDVHEGATVTEELLAAMTKRAPSLGALASHLPQALIDLVDRALAFEQTDRWSSAREMQAAVRSVARGPALESTRSTRSSSSRKLVLADSPTLVTPSLPPLSSSKTPQSPALRPAAIIALSAVTSFVALIAFRQHRHFLQPGAAPRADVAMQQVSIHTDPAEERPTRAAQPVAWETAPATSSSSLASREATPPPPKVSSARPKPAAGGAEEVRTMVATRVRAPSAPLSPEHARTPTAADPLDRRK